MGRFRVQNAFHGVAFGRRGGFVLVTFFPVFVDFVVDLADDGATEPNTLLFFAGRAQHGREAEPQQDRNEDFAQLRIQ